MTGRTITPRAVAAAASLAIAALWTPRVAEAQRYKRATQLPKIEVAQTATWRLAAKPAQAPRPGVTADQFVTAQIGAANVRPHQIQQLQLQIANPAGSTPLPALLFQLADLHVQKARYWRFQAEAVAATLASASPAQRGALKAKQRRYEVASKQSLLNAVKAFKRVADNQNFRNYARMDEVLFHYATALHDGGYMKEARKVYHRLIKDHPKSAFIPEAYLAFAEFYFAQNSMANAERFYDKVAQFPKTSLFDFALYMKGWAIYKRGGRMPEVLNTWYEVARRTSGDAQREALNRAAKRDLVRAYAEVGKPEKAYRFFQRTDRREAFEMLQQLGDRYVEVGMFAKATSTFREMIRLQPRHAQVCKWQVEVVHAALSIGSNADKTREIENLVKLWAAYKDKDILPAAGLAECKAEAEAVTGEMAKVWHSEALRALDLEVLAHAGRLYQLFLANFPASSERDAVQFYYAELMWTRAAHESNRRLATRMWERTADAFSDVVKAGALPADKRVESARAAVLAWKNALDIDPRTPPPAAPTARKSGKPPAPRAIPSRERQLIAAFAAYAPFIADPWDAEIAMMKFLEARICWRFDHFDKAVPLLVDLVEHHIDHETSEAAVHLLLDSLSKTRRDVELRKWVAVMLAKTGYLAARPALKQRLERLGSRP